MRAGESAFAPFFGLSRACRAKELPMPIHTLPADAAVQDRALAQPIAKPLTEVLNLIVTDAQTDSAEYLSGSETPHGGE